MSCEIAKRCRVCLDEFDESAMCDLFQEQEGESGIRLSEKVEFCCGVRLRESDEMPTKICSKCNEITRMWFNFRQMCVNSQVYLESSCKDRLNSAQCSENVGDYFEYLLNDLQSFRAKACEKNKALEVNLNMAALSETEYIDEEYDKEHDMKTEITFQTANEETFDSEREFEEYLDVMKEEDEEGELEFIDIVTEPKSHQISAQTKTQRAKSEETIEENNEVAIEPKKGEKKRSKSSKYVSKKSLRPPTPTSYMCAICGNVYKNKNAFNYHMSVHANFKPHECELCGKKFRQICQYNRHMRRHTGEKPYKCKFCDRHFYDSTDKQRHERTHTKEKPYKCNICEKAFGLASILRAHEKLHNNEKDFHCFVCSKSFTLRHQLTSHCATKQHITAARQEQEADGIEEYQ